MYKENNGSIDVFDRWYFESILPTGKVTGKKLWSRRENYGEWEYLIDMGDPEVFIRVRSSVQTATDMSAETGEDSIRAWLVHVRPDGEFPISEKVTRWTTRQAGWEDRLWKIFSLLREWRQAAGDCIECGRPRRIFKVKKSGVNNGRYFAKCCESDKGSNFVWLT
jgi:hypothetical protein